MPDTLTTERLVLRRPRPGDVDAYLDGFAHWPTASMLTKPKWPVTRASIEGYLARASEQSWSFVITEAEEDRAIGNVSIRGHLGYWLRSDRWGRGYVTEAARTVIDAWFADPLSETLVSGAFEENAASRRVLGKLGFAETRLSLQYCTPRGAEVVHVDMSLPRVVWQARRAA